MLVKVAKTISPVSDPDEDSKAAGVYTGQL